MIPGTENIKGYFAFWPLKLNARNITSEQRVALRFMEPTYTKNATIGTIGHSFWWWRFRVQTAITRSTFVVVYCKLCINIIFIEINWKLESAARLNVLSEVAYFALTWPSKRKALPDTNGLPARIQASFNRYLVATLSVASSIISYLRIKCKDDFVFHEIHEWWITV